LDFEAEVEGLRGFLGRTEALKGRLLAALAPLGEAM
jgi:hypothetical protein